MISFVDRVSAYPNRYIMTDENGNASYIVLERADDPITVGTPMNAETFNELAESIPTITSGSDEPSGGNSGDIYFQIIEG